MLVCPPGERLLQALLMKVLMVIQLANGAASEESDLTAMTSMWSAVAFGLQVRRRIDLKVCNQGGWELIWTAPLEQRG